MLNWLKLIKIVSIKFYRFFHIKFTVGIWVLVHLPVAHYETVIKLPDYLAADIRLEVVAFHGVKFMDILFSRI